jgi:alpha-beta hydrolase superfamily lysophospholipase
MKETGAIRAVVILCHGLNMKPSKMAALGQLLAERGASVHYLSLAGHGASLEEFRQATRTKWLVQCQAAYDLGHAQAQKEQVPLYFVGFSHGALVNLDLMNSVSGRPLQYDKMVLLAPAISTHRFTHLVLALHGLVPNWMLASQNPEEYRAHPGTPLTAYRALFDSQKALKKGRYRGINLPTLVLISPKDELVSPRGIAKIMRDHQLTQWRLSPVDNSRATLNQCPRHLIVDEGSVGVTQWESVKNMVLNHFDLG